MEQVLINFGYLIGLIGFLLAYLSLREIEKNDRITFSGMIAKVFFLFFFYFLFFYLGFVGFL